MSPEFYRESLLPAPNLIASAREGDYSRANPGCRFLVINAGRVNCFDVRSYMKY